MWLQDRKRVLVFIKTFAQITELYEDSPEGLMKQNKSRRDHGIPAPRLP
jgi:hypothetical protein